MHIHTILSVTALKRYPGSQEPRTTTDPHCITNLTQQIVRGKSSKVAASAQARSNREGSRNRVSVAFQGRGQSCPGWAAVGFQGQSLGFSIGWVLCRVGAL